MSLTDFLMSLDDAQWRWLLSEVPRLYKVSAARLPPWDTWVELRDRIGAARRQARRALTLANAQTKKAARKAYMADYMRRRRESRTAAS